RALAYCRLETAPVRGRRSSFPVPCYHHGLKRQPVNLAQALRFGFELPTGGQYVAAARRTNRRGVTRIVDEIGEALDRLPIRALVVRAGPGIERDEIDLGGDALQQRHERAGICQ